MRYSTTNNPFADPFSGEVPERPISHDSMPQPVRQTESLTDLEALNRIGTKISTSAQENWLRGQFETRTPWPKRERLDAVSKDGHPLLFHPRIFGLMEHIKKYPYDSRSDEAYRSDLHFFKIDFSVASGLPESFFDYLDVLSPQEFREWLSNALTTIRESNSHWVKFVKNLLEENGIDSSDLVEGKLSKHDQELIKQIYKAILNISNSENIQELLKHLEASESFGIPRAMTIAHASWRKSRYTLNAIAPDEQQSTIMGRKVSTHIFHELFETVKTFMSNNPEFNANELLKLVQNFRAKHEADETVSAESTFTLMVNIARYLDTLINAQIGTPDNRIEIGIALKELVKIVALDANPAPFKTAVDLMNQALQAKGLEA